MAKKYTCPACDGKKVEWVDWANDWAPCHVCREKGHVRKQCYQKITRRRMAYYANKPSLLVGYRIQEKRVHYNNFDAVSRIEWKTIRTVCTVKYGLKLADMLNNEVYDDEFMPRYRLASADSRVVTSSGYDGEVAYASHTFYNPFER